MNQHHLPVVAVGTDLKFPTMEAAGRFVGRHGNSIKSACERGGKCAGYWWRYADMPASCQPLKQPRARMIRCLDTDEEFASIKDIVGSDMLKRSRFRWALLAERRFEDGKHYAYVPLHEQLDRVSA